MSATERTPTSRQWEQARRRVKGVIDGPNTDIDRMIRAVLANGHVPDDPKEVFPFRPSSTLATGRGSRAICGPVQP